LLVTGKSPSVRLDVARCAILRASFWKRSCATVGHPVLPMCASNCIIERDAAGNRKLCKKRSTGRIDGTVCLTMALGVAPLRSAARFDVEALIA